MVGWLLFFPLVVTLGACAMRWLVLPRTRTAGVVVDLHALRSMAARATSAVAILLPAALFLVLLRQLADFRDPFATWSDDARLLLTGTSWGRTWIVGFVLGCLAPVLFAFARSGRIAWSAATACALALGTFPALTGHANTAGPLRPLTLTADVLHVWAAGAWIGGLGVMLWLDFAWRLRRPGDPGLLRALVPRFSAVAASSVAILILSGATAAWVHLPEASALWTGAYGRTLALKVALAAVVLLIGFLNWRRLTPRLARPAAPATLSRTALAEFLVAQVVLLVTAVLVRTPPGG